MKPDGYGSVRDAADMSGLSERHIWRLIGSGQVASVRDGAEGHKARHVWVKLDELPERDDETDLRSRLAALERRVAALERRQYTPPNALRAKSERPRPERRVSPPVPPESRPSNAQGAILADGEMAWRVQDSPRRGNREIGEMLVVHGATSSDTARSWGGYWGMPTDSFHAALSAALERSKDPRYQTGRGRFAQHFHACADGCYACRDLDFHYPDMS